MPPRMRAILALGLLFALVQCGGKKGRSSDVSIEAKPEKPLVINAPVKIGDRTLSAPWFNFQLKVTNSSDLPLTLIALEVTVTSYTASGPQDQTAGFAASDQNTTVTINEATFECKYVAYKTIEKGQTAFLGIEHGSTVCPTGAVTFYVDGVTADKTNPNFRFRVTVKPAGWFGTFADPKERVSRSFTFFTE